MTSDRSPTHISTWFFPLPEPIGIPQGATLLMQYDSRNVPYVQGGAREGVRAADMLLSATGPLDVAVRLWHVPIASIAMDQMVKLQAALAVSDVVTGKTSKLTPPTLDEILGSTRGKPTTLVSVAEVAAFENDAESGGVGVVGQVDIDDLSDPMLRGLHCVRQLVRAYRIASQTPVIAPAYARLPKYVPVARKAIGSEPGDWIASGVVPVEHDNQPIKAPEPADPETTGRWASSIHLLSAEDPLSLFNDRLLEATRLLTVEGDPSAALLLCAIASEALLDSLLALMLWEEVGGAPAADGPVAEAADSLARDLRPRLRVEYPQRLGGSWDLTRPGPLADWQEKVARIRNRAVHRGYEPRPVEAEDAIDASRALLEHLVDRLAKRARKYRRTALMFLGEQGLRDRGEWLSVRAFLAGPAKSEPPWRDNYSAWRNVVDREVEQRARR